MFLRIIFTFCLKETDMKRSQIENMPQFFDRYIKLADDIDIVEALEKYSTIESLIDKNTMEKLGDKVYAEGKWNVKQILQHMIDNERVQAYRALRIARNDKTPLPGYDENLFAANVSVSGRDVGELLEEFAIVRRSNVMLFENNFQDVWGSIMISAEGLLNSSFVRFQVPFFLSKYQSPPTGVLTLNLMPVPSSAFT